MDAGTFLAVLERRAATHGIKGSMKYLTPRQLVDRWENQVVLGTLNNWRAQKRGPAYVKIGAKVLYPIAEVEKYEAQQLHASNDNAKA